MYRHLRRSNRWLSPLLAVMVIVGVVQGGQSRCCGATCDVLGRSTMQSQTAAPAQSGGDARSCCPHSVPAETFSQHCSEACQVCLALCGCCTGHKRRPTDDLTGRQSAEGLQSAESGSIASVASECVCRATSPLNSSNVPVRVLAEGQIPQVLLLAWVTGDLACTPTSDCLRVLVTRESLVAGAPPIRVRYCVWTT